MLPRARTRALQLDLDIDPGRQVELHQGIDGLWRRIDDIEEPLVRAHLELFPALLVDMWRAQHGELLHPRRQRNRAAYLRTGALCRVDDLPRGGIEDSMIERLEPDADVLSVHVALPVSGGDAGKAPRHGCVCYSMICETTPAPTVRPPSRMANRSRSSIAIGTISSTSIVTLSPGITISVPSGSCTTPVTSVVRK